MKALIVLLSVVCATSALSLDHHFNLFKIRHGKKYQTTEEVGIIAALLLLSCTFFCFFCKKKCQNIIIFSIFTQHELRRSIFADNLRAIEKHNAEHALGLHSYTLGVNKFADMSHEEFLSKFTAPIKKNYRSRVGSYKTVDTSSLPAEIDWRDEVYDISSS